MDLSIYNCFQVWTILKQNSKLSHRDFLLEMIQSIFDKYPPVILNRGRKSDQKMIKNEVPRSVENHYPKPIFHPNVF